LGVSQTSSFPQFVLVTKAKWAFRANFPANFSNEDPWFGLTHPEHVPARRTMLQQMSNLWQRLSSPAGKETPYTLDVMTLEDRVLFSATPLLLDAATAGGTAPDATITAEDLAAAGVVGNDVDGSHAVGADGNAGWSSDGFDSLLQHADDGSLFSTVLAGTDASALAPSTGAAPDAFHHVTHELLVVDSAIDNVSTLVQELLHDASQDRQFEIVYLDHHSEALTQIGSALNGDVKFDAVHLLAHGEDGKIMLGDTVLDHHAIEARLDQIQHWADSLTADADILLYGCDVAAGSAGQTFLQELSQVTGADVAASDDLTGTAALGGDWDLEAHFGSIETHSLAAAEEGDWQGVLATFTVDNNNDSGAGSLRQAILDANANAGTDTIDFSINGNSVHTISLLSDLPVITEAVIIDATTQHGYSGTPKIELDGSGYTGSVGAGFYIEANGTTIRGFSIVGFDDDGIEITGDAGGGANNTIENNYIGLHADGTVGANADMGVLIRSGATGNIIQNNVISGNGNHGIQIRNAGTDNNVVTGNIIGLTTNGTAAAANGGSGIQIYDYASNNQIGGTTAAERNIISGNTAYGIHLYSNVSDNQILGNYIGTNQAGTAAIGNTLDGIMVQDGSHDNIIGGSTSGSRNIISGNQNGIDFDGSGVTGNLVEGNYIGTNATGAAAIANTASGIRIANGAALNTIGETNTGEGNIIANSGSDGITVLAAAGSQNYFYGNSIYSNTGLGIDLKDDGVTANDANDADAGANGLQNFPTITQVITNAGSHVRIQGTINSTANTNLTLHFYSSTSADASGFDEGRTYLGSVNVTTDASGNATWFQQINGVSVAAGSYITATATSTAASGGTSEFSAAVTAVGEYGIWLSTDANATSTTGGLTSWNDSTIVRITDPNLSLGSGTTNGTASAVFDADNFAADGAAKVEGLEYIDSSVVVGTINAITLQQGDVLFTVKDGETFNGLVVNDKDIILFRPTAVGDYSSGTFSLFMHNPNNNGNHIRDFAVVESAMTVGGTLLQSGDLLMVFSSATYDKDIQLFQATDMGATNTAGNMSVLIDGSSAGIGFAQQIWGLDIVNYDTTLGGTALTKGQILISLDNDDTVGSNNLAVTENDIFLLSVTATGMNTSSATASILFRGSDVGLTGAGERYDALALRSAAPDTPPEITSNGGGNDAYINVAENSTAVTTVTATDSDVPAQVISYSILGGNDASLFTINSSTGALSFVSGRDYETPSDFGGDGVYEVIVAASDGTLMDAQMMYITVTNVNEAPVDSVPGSQSVAEDGTLTLSAAGGNGISISDVDVGSGTMQVSLTATNGTLSLSTIVGLVFTTGDGTADGSMQFTGTLADINAALDGLTFSPTANFNGSGGINIVTSDLGNSGSGGVKTDSDGISITVTPVNDAPVLDATKSPTLNSELEDAAAPIGAVGTLVSSLVDYNGGGGNDNVSEVDSGAVLGIALTGADTTNGTWYYSTNNGGSWSALGSVSDSSALLLNADANTRLYFKPTADFNGTINGAITFRAWDRTSGSNGTVADASVNGGTTAFSTSSDTAALTITAVNDAPSITSDGGGASASVSIAENTTAVTTVTSSDIDGGTPVYSIFGGADAGKFSIDSSTGVLTFVTAPDYDIPGDAGGNNVYDVIVQVSDGAGGTDTQAIAVSITPVNDNDPMITSDGGGASATVSVAENNTAVTTVTATDADLPAQTLTYTIVGGADAALFSLDANTGVLTFNAGPDYEQPLDAGGDNTYDVVVQVSDGAGRTDTQAIAVSVTPVNDNSPIISSDGGGPTANVNVSENTTAVTTVIASDADLPGQTLTYSIVGGADAGQFSIDASTGVLTFNAAPNYEDPLDAGGNNVYDVTVQVDDGAGGMTTQSISVTVVNANEVPSGTSGSVTGLEDTPIVFSAGDFGFTDPDAGDSLGGVRIDTLPGQGTLTLSGTGVTAGQIIDISDIAAGNLQFTPGTNDNGAGYASLTFTVQDQGGLFAASSDVLTINVTAVNDAPNAVGETFSVFAGSSILSSAPGLLANDSDVEHDPLSLVLVSAPSHGTLLIKADGSFTYVTDPTFFGTDTFTYRVSDGTASTLATVQIHINAFGASGGGTDTNSGGGGTGNTNNGGTNNGGSAPPPIFIPPEDSKNDRPVAQNPAPPPPDHNGNSQNGNGQQAEKEPRQRGLNAADLVDILGVHRSTAAIGSLAAGKRTYEALTQMPVADAQTLSLLLDSLRKELQGNSQFRDVALSTASAATAALSAGYALWALKSGHLLASLLTGMPAWKHLDPIAVLQGSRQGDDDEESLADIAGKGELVANR
jgi:hypothetical protein